MHHNWHHLKTMKTLLLSILLILLSINTQLFGQLTITELGKLPEPVANNAVTEGFIDGVPYLFSFAGIDSTKTFSSTHLKSFKVNLETGESERIADLPGDQGLLGVGASRIGNIIYIVGGYTVNSDGSEVSSPKVRRYDIENNIFLEDAADLIIATDDHVQTVWNDSLLYVITGWSNTGNIRNTQIYNPTTDIWTEGTLVPNILYRAFGASGTILNDTIYYFGGATSSGSFGIQNRLIKGAINLNDPSEITWSISTPNPDIDGYRMASTVVGEEVHWVGGSNNTYNYNGIAYDGSGGVSPSNQDITLDVNEGNLDRIIYPKIPMDLRGIANISDRIKYIAGGMEDDQVVSDKVLKLEWASTPSSTSKHLDTKKSIEVFPNPATSHLNISNQGSELIISYRLININGQTILKGPRQETINIRALPPGVYHLEIELESGKLVTEIVQIIDL